MYLLQDSGWGQYDISPSVHLGSTSSGVVLVVVGADVVSVVVVSVVVVSAVVVSVVVVSVVVSVVASVVVSVVVSGVDVVVTVEVVVEPGAVLVVGVVVGSVVVDSVGDPEPPLHSAYSGDTQPLLFSLKNNPSEHSSIENVPLKHL
jgi:hypothetical protein